MIFIFAGNVNIKACVVLKRILKKGFVMSKDQNVRQKWKIYWTPIKVSWSKICFVMKKKYFTKILIYIYIKLDVCMSVCSLFSILKHLQLVCTDRPIEVTHVKPHMDT